MGVKVLIYDPDRFRYSPVRKIGMEMKKPPIAHTLDTDDFCRYLFSLERRRK